MNPAEFEEKMRAGEAFHSLRVPQGWMVLRVDGRGFTRFTESRFQKPFDPRFRDCMVEVARELMSEFQGVYAFTESDETSILLSEGCSLFDRELEKLVSISAGIASAAFSIACGEAAHFDSRVWLGESPESVSDYFLWRQFDTTRCCLNGWCYWTLRNGRADSTAASKELERRGAAWKRKFLQSQGIAFDALPGWQTHGIGCYGESYEKQGHNPLTGAVATATRRRAKVDMDLPSGEAYRRFVSDLLEGSQARPKK